MLEQTHSLGLHAKLFLDRFILSPPGWGWKTPNSVHNSEVASHSGTETKLNVHAQLGLQTIFNQYCQNRFWVQTTWHQSCVHNLWNNKK